MNLTGDYLVVESNAPLRGLATTPPSTRLDPAFSPRLLNCIVRDGIVRRRAGYRQLGRTLVGQVLAITEFGEIGEDPWFVVLTSRRQYAYQPTDEDFVDLTPGQVTYPIIDISIGVFIIAGSHVADFPVGRLIPVIDGVNEGVYTVTNAIVNGATTEIYVSETIPDSNDSTGSIVIADDLITEEGDIIDFVGITDLNGRRLIITNGRDTPRVWDGDITGTFVDWAPIFTGFVTCKTLAVFSERLFLGGVTTADNEPQLVAWSTTGDFDDFDDTVNGSGVQLLYQLTGGVKLMKALGDRLAIYSDDAIMSATFVDGDAIFAFEVVIPEGTRLASPKSVVSINVGHIYASEENFYIFDGTRGLQVLGNPIYSDYKGRKDQELLYRCAALNDYSKRTILMAVPDVEGGTMVYTMEYDVFNLSSIVWAREKYADDPLTFGFFTNRDAPITWDDAPWEAPNTTWTLELGAWAEEAEQLRFPIRCFGTDEGKVFLVTETSITDNGTSVEQSYETMDFAVPEAFHSLYGRWAELEFEGYGSEVDVSVSVDQGRSFSDIETVTLSGSPEHHSVLFDKSGRTLRVKFTSDTDFALRWVRLWVRPGAPR